MHQIGISFFYSLLLVSNSLAGVSFAQAQETDQEATTTGGAVYKKVNPDGSVTYSDRPSPDAKEVQVPKGTEYTPPKLPAFTPYSPPKVEKKFKYSMFALTAPKNEESIWDNTGNVTATVALEPSLQFGHSIEFLLDGISVARGGATSHQFLNVDRGEHQITAQIVDRSDQVLSSSTVTFYMKRHAIGN